MTLGSKIQKLRKSRSLSQEAFADIMNVSRQSVSKWELDQTYPEINKLIEIADYFGVSLDDLLRDNADSTESIQCMNKEQASQTEVPDKGYEENGNITNNNSNIIPVKGKALLFLAILFVFILYGSLTGNYNALIAYISSSAAVVFVRALKVKINK